jgi:phosphoribosyl 1,2-cyclic phosphodiesterase
MGFIKFLGTAGARFVMIRQLRSSAGLWLNWRSTNVLIDPGPGSIVRCNASKPKLNPEGLDAIILTHKHLDHSGDINVMVEAMTSGGFRKRGVLFLPQDALGDEGPMYTYLRDFVEKKTILDKGKFSIGDINFTVPIENRHPAMTYGLKFYLGNDVVSVISDTEYFEELASAYKDSTILVLNVVFYQRREGVQHLCLEDALKIVEQIRPAKTILTHFGMTMLKEKPHLLEKKLKDSLNLDIQCAYDGMTLDLR